jgi:CBS-domain-containing membrane protein
MQKHQLRRLMVLDNDRHIVGVVSLGDIARKSGDHQMAGATMQQVAAGA